MLRITGGKVYDPANGIDGVVKDLWIADGRIVADPGEEKAHRTIDATGTIVFPGGVDVHTHVAGGALNFARGLVPENQRAAEGSISERSSDASTSEGSLVSTSWSTSLPPMSVTRSVTSVSARAT